GIAQTGFHSNYHLPPPFLDSVSSNQNELTTQERSAFSWLANQIFHPRHQKLHPDKIIPCSGVFCKITVDWSQPISVDAFIEAWHHNPARNWTITEVINWVDSRCERPSVRKALRQNLIDGRTLASLLVAESRAFGRGYPLPAEDLFWLKERIAALILFGPPPPITFGVALSSSVASIFLVLLNICWQFWYHLIRPQTVTQRILTVIIRLEQSLSRLRTRLTLIRESLSRSMSARPLGDTPKSTDFTHQIDAHYQCIMSEVNFAESMLEFVQSVVDDVQSEVIQNPRGWMSYAATQHLNRLISFADTLRLRVNAVKFQASAFSNMQEQLFTSVHPVVETHSHALQQTPVVPTCLSPYYCSDMKVCSSAESMECDSISLTQDQTPSGERTNEVLHCTSFTHTEHTPTSTQYANSMQSDDPKHCSVDPDEEPPSNQYSNGSPNENQPNDQVPQNQTDGKTATSKIPQLFRATPSHALAPLFSVMNPSTTRWDGNQSNFATPSHIPVGSLHFGSTTAERTAFKSQPSIPVYQPTVNTGSCISRTLGGTFLPAHNSDN
ncbi:hypothetical protein FGIG_09364, partial [Fasciola gigantica]